MVKNFLAMPTPLKLIVLSAVSAAVFLAGTAVTTGPVLVFGQRMTSFEWWTSGAGLALLPAAAIGCAAAILMIRRSRYGRPAYILMLVAAYLSSPVVAHLVGTGIATARPTLVAGLVVCVIASVYLYRSRAVDHYFEPQ
jgi:hypothetical protein